MLVILCLAHAITLAMVPVWSMPRWAQLLYLALQCGLAVVAQSLAPVSLLVYVYLAIVLQAIVLFPLWLSISFALAVYALWSGLLALATSGFLAWLQGNLALAFPVSCALIAGIVYVRQQRRSEQVQQMLQQVQAHYDQLASNMRELQQRAMIEERRRLAQTLMGEIQGALSRSEQALSTALAVAQSNLSRMDGTVAQARDALGLTVERLRTTIATLRGGEAPALPGPPLTASLPPTDEPVITIRSDRVLAWVLPLAFLSLVGGLTLLQQEPIGENLLPLLLSASLLLATYTCTHHTQNRLLFHAGLAGQIVIVLLMAWLSHTPAMLLGLLLVLWQLAIRLTARQIGLYSLGMSLTALAVARSSDPSLGIEQLLAGGVAAITVSGPLVLARRQLEQRRQSELQLALLNAEIEQQTALVRALAVTAERTRLAREVHDDLGSRLMLINLQLQLAEELAVEDTDAALAQLQGSRELLRTAWAAVQAVADAELPPGCEDLPAALRELAARTALPVDLRMAGELSELPSALRMAIYRTAQEGLTNACKHARPARIMLEVVADSVMVCVRVQNDGPTQCPGALSSGFGLLGLRERVQGVGGTIEAGFISSGGWCLQAALPLGARDEGWHLR